jgi:hypothetical protein
MTRKKVDCNYICCQGTTTYEANDFCTGIADGSSCWSDTMCSSGYCFDNCDGQCRGTCYTKNLSCYSAITSLTCEAAGLDTIFDTSECLEAAQTLSKKVTYDVRNQQYIDIIFCESQSFHTPYCQQPRAAPSIHKSVPVGQSPGVCHSTHSSGP